MHMVSGALGSLGFSIKHILRQQKLNLNSAAGMTADTANDLKNDLWTKGIVSWFRLSSYRIRSTENT